jgi:hypothetical protein
LYSMASISWSAKVSDIGELIPSPVRPAEADFCISASSERRAGPRDIAYAMRAKSSPFPAMPMNTAAQGAGKSGSICVFIKILQQRTPQHRP